MYRGVALSLDHLPGSNKRRRLLSPGVLYQGWARYTAVRVLAVLTTVYTALLHDGCI